jgi:cytochrome c oxidase assembly factor CtaG
MVALMPADGSRQQFYSFPRLAVQTVFRPFLRTRYWQVCRTAFLVSAMLASFQTSQSPVQTQGMAPKKEHSVEHPTFYRTHSPLRTLQKLAGPTTLTGGRPRGYRAR